MTAALISDPFAHWVDSLHHADPLTLAHEAERLAYEEPSPLVVRMRDAVDAEKATRATTTAGRD
jgi:hypothetical protein